MKITIFSAGSRGDIQPCVALAVGLQNSGYQVSLAAPENFAGFAQENNVDFRPLQGDVQKIMSGEFGRDFLEKGSSNPLKTVAAIRKMITPIVKDMLQDAYQACQDADGIICLGVFSPLGKTIADALHLPLINIEPTPLLPTRSFAAPSWPIQRDLGGLHNWISGFVMLYMIWMWYSPFVKDFRKYLGLPAVSAGYFYRALKSTPMLSAYSPAIVPHPADWPQSVHITGDYPLDFESEWQPPSELLTFLETGDPPVYIGFGSMSGSDPASLADLVLKGLKKSGQRGVLLTGWGGLQFQQKTDNIYILESAPHRWLFPRMAAVVHHGGAGTTAEGLRAGVPSVIIPFGFDQFFWGARIKAMGLGPSPIPRKKLTSDRLADAIRIAVTDPLMKQRAADCGRSIRAEDGVSNAVKIVRRYFGEPNLFESEPGK